MAAEITIPDIDWYVATSARLGLSPRCPFASVKRCPRYYQSLSLLGEARFTKIDAQEDENLLRLWKGSDLWPRTDEHATTLYTSSNALGQTSAWMYSNFCPETIYDGFGLFTSSLSRYPNETDLDNAHRRLSRIGADSRDWRWQWYHARAMHYSECPLYSALSRDRSGTMSMTDTKRTYLVGKLASIADEAIEKSLIAVKDARSEITLANQLGNSRAYLVYNDRVFEVMMEALPRMARVTYQVSNGHSDDAANALDDATTAIVQRITDILNKRFQTPARAFGDKPLVDQLTQRLTALKDRVVEDFKNGIDGDGPLAKQQSGNIYVTQSNSPGAQLAVGDGNVQTMQNLSTSLVNTINEVTTSTYLTSLGEDKAELVSALADSVREELQKPSIDASKVKKVTDRIGEILKVGGLVAEAARLAKALAEWIAGLGGG